MNPRRVRRVLAALALALCVLLVLAAIAIHTPPVRRYAMRQVMRVLEQQQIELNLEDLRYNLFTTSVSTRNVRVRSQRLPDAPAFATIDSARIDLSLLQLLRGRYVIQSGALDGLEIHYLVDEQGRNNLPAPPRNPDAPRRTIDYLVARLSISNAHVRYEHRPQRIDLTLPISSADVRGNPLTDRHRVHLESAMGQVEVQGRAAPLDRLAGDLDVGADGIMLEGVDVDTAGSRVRTTGSITWLDPPTADLTFRADIDAARAAPLAGIDEPVSGRLMVDAGAKGPLAALAVTARVSGADLQYRELTDTTLDAEGAYDPATRRAAVSSLQIRGPWGGAAAKGDLSLDAPAPSHLEATVTGLRVEPMMRLFGLSWSVTSRVDGTIRAEWPGREYAKAAGEARATLTPTMPRAFRSHLPVGGRVIARARDGRTVVELRNIQSGGADLSGNVIFAGNRRLGGAVAGTVEDVGRLIATIEAFVGRPQGTLLPTPVTGAAHLDAQIAGTFDTPAITTKVGAPEVTLGTAKGLSVNADVSYVPAAVTIDDADVLWHDARAHLNGRIGLRGDRRIDLKWTTDDLRLPSLLEAMNQPPLPLAGTVSAQGTVGGQTERPVVTAAVHGSELVAYGETWGTLQADVTLAGGELGVTRLVIDKPQPERNGRIEAKGTYDLGRKTHALEFKSNNVQLLGLELPNGNRVRGTLALEGHLAGSLTSPEGTIHLEADALEIDRGTTAQLGHITLDAVAGDGQAKVKATAERFNLDVDGTVGLARPWPTTATITARGLDLAALPLDGPPQLAGSLRATVETSGPLTEPARMNATMALQSLMGSWKGRPFSVTAPARLRYADERLEIERIEMEASGSALVASGVLPLTPRSGQGELRVDLRANLATLTPYLPREANVSGDGAVTVTGSLRGTFEAIDPDLLVTIERGLILSPRLEPGFSNIELRAQVRDGEAQIQQLTANWGTAALAASGRVPLEVVPPLPVEIPRMGGPTTVKLTVTGLDPSAIPGAPARLGGRVSVEADLSATRAELAALDGRLLFRELDLAFAGLTLAQQEPSRIAISAATASIEQLALSGSAGALAARGQAGLTRGGALDLTVDGNLNVGAVTVLTNRIRAEGNSTLKVHAGGTIAEPDVTGTVTLADAIMVSDEPNIAAENIAASIVLAGRRVELTRLTGDVNGGTFEASGSLTLENGGPRDLDLALSTVDFAYDAPLDLRSVSDGTVKITSSGDAVLVSGKVTIKEGGLTGDVNFDTGLLAAITARRTLDLTEERETLLERTRFAVDVETTSPILVDNNLARAEINTDLRITGTPYQPGLTGRMTIREGGTVRLNERQYEVQRGLISFVDDRRIYPAFDLELNTSAGNYDITVGVAGTPGDITTTLTSEPSLPEPDIMAMLVTGRTLDDMRGEEFEVAREQVLSYLAGRIGSTLGRGLQRATGLSEVRIEPTLIANEADPGARLTVGQDLTDELKLVYSTNLADSNDQIWVAEYDVTRRFQTRAVRQGDDTYRLDFHHDVRLGGQRAPRRIPRVRPTVMEVVATSATGEPVPEPEVAERFKVKVGDSYDFFAIRNGIERVENAFIDEGYLQSRVRLEREVENMTARLRLRVTRGPRVELQFAGAMPPESVVREVRTQWHRGVFDKQRGDDGVEALREWLMRDDHLQPRVEYRIEDVSADQRRVVFQIDPGARYSTVILAFEGASGIDPDELDQIIDEQKLERQLFTDPLVVTELLERYYHEQGYLVAEIDEPRYELQGPQARVVLAVREGPRFSVRRVAASGNHAYTSEALLAELPLMPGQPYLPAASEQALERIRELYWRLGYNDVRSDHDLVLDRAAGVVDVAFTVSEGAQTFISDVVVAGNQKISEQLVRGQLEVNPGTTLDLSALARSRRNLYATGAFSVVEITPVRVDFQTGPPAASASDAQETPAVEQETVRVDVSLREVQPIQLRYGGSYDTERGAGGLFDVAYHNFLGGARVVGLRSRYDRQLHEGRVYINQPAVRLLPFKTTGSIYFREDLSPPTNLTRAFNANRKGVSVQQETELRNKYVWSWGYRYEHAQVLEPTSTALIRESLTVSPVTTTFTRETRDDVLDATTGSFIAHAFAYSPRFLGSTQPYIKYFGQYFRYQPLQAPKRKPLTNELLRPRLVYAAGVRFGLAHSFGSVTVVPRIERFLAGGSTTLRGFAQNAVGPISADLVPVGGDAILIVNNELRMPLVSIVDGVAFVDIGNVFPHVKDFSFTDLRKSAGFGVRVRTPWFLVRGDYGVVLDQRPGERRGRFYFSIGQAF